MHAANAIQLEVMIEDVRGYGAEAVARLRRALETNCPARPDPRHAHLFVIEAPADCFYISPLPSGKVLLLARWKPSQGLSRVK